MAHKQGRGSQADHLADFRESGWPADVRRRPPKRSDADDDEPENTEPYEAPAYDLKQTSGDQDLDLVTLFYDDAAKHRLLTKEEEVTLGRSIEKSLQLRKHVKKLADPNVSQVTNSILGDIYRAILDGEPTPDGTQASPIENDTKTLRWLTQDEWAREVMGAPPPKKDNPKGRVGSETPARIDLDRNLQLLPTVAFDKFKDETPHRFRTTEMNPGYQNWLNENSSRFDEHYRMVREQGSKAIETLTLCNMRLVINLAKNMGHQGLPVMDLVQEGTLGLMQAARKYDHRKGWKFSTYATWWIRQALSRAIADQARVIRLPVHMKERINRAQRAQRAATAKLNREATPTDVAALMGISEKKVEETNQFARPTLSLDHKISDEQNTTLMELIEDTESESTESEVERRAVSEDIQKALAALTDRQQLVISERYGLLDGRPKTLQEVGENIGVSRERIRQIENKALRTLRKSPNTQFLREYLRD